MPYFMKAESKVQSKVPAVKYFCANGSKYLEELYKPLLATLLIIRDDSKVFKFIVDMIDKYKGLDEDTLNYLANDIVLFLLEDFTSVENYAAHCMVLFKPLIYVLTFLRSRTCLLRGKRE